MNKAIITLCVLPLALLTTGCGNKVQKLCEANVKEQLLNPETVDFRDFQSLTPKQVKEDETYSYLSTSEFFDMTLEGVKERNFHTARVRAEGQLGNKVTNTAVCATDTAGEKCSCMLLNS